ncbi:MAG: anthranilate synthase component I family protein [Flavobacteriales bacterium]|nr:anthranilate synthase component I family protein [Flavobacteriales bacterium]
MRTTIELGEVAAFNWDALRSEEHFLFRRIADHDRSVLAIGMKEELVAPGFDAQGCATDWVFGALRYEWKDELFHASPTDPANARWWIPRLVVEWRGKNVSLHVHQDEVERSLKWCKDAFQDRRSGTYATPSIHWRSHTTKAEYIRRTQQLLAHIQRGDIYEVNYCTTRSASVPEFDPFLSFETLLSRSQAPFAAFHRRNEAFALCASPERYLAFDHRRVVGEPMKGTRPRHADPEQDRRAAEELATDAKERSENIMALDVMRNDLSRIAATRSVRVEELCAVRSYQRVHQMVSTVSAEMRNDLTPMDVLRASFPMASMTGAPKRRAMELIQDVEEGPRGPFSGSLGFFDPYGTGDFNVVIRTVLFNAANGSLSLTTGSAITAQCDPESEYEECQVKARSVIEALCHA